MPNPTDQKPFFNVMPEINSTPPKTETKTIPVPIPVPMSNPDQTKGNLSIASTSHNTKTILIIVIIGLLLAGAGVTVWLTTNKSAEDIKITDQPITPIIDNPQVAEVTTSAEWLMSFFGAEVCIEITICGDNADPDRDGLINKLEFEIGTGPNNSDADADGIADGDEIRIFNTDPLLARTYREGQYNDTDFIKGGYDIKTNTPYSPERLMQIKALIKQFGLHQPTLATLGLLSFQLYDFTDPNSTTLPTNLDTSPDAKLNRDSQRQNTIRKVGFTLLKYYESKKQYPATKIFTEMVDLVKIYNTVATNYTDPVNRDPYLYGYQPADKNTEFVLTYYSETHGKLIKYFTKNAKEDFQKENELAIDEQRKRDLENIRQALLVYSGSQLNPDNNSKFVFPTKENYKSTLTPKYLTALPIDPVSKLDYDYQVNSNLENFTLKSALQITTTGITGYMCNVEGCKNY
jgi:hypothetical protein